MSLKMNQKEKKVKMGKSHRIKDNHLLLLIKLATQYLVLSKTLKIQILVQHVPQCSYSKWVVHKLFAKALNTICNTRR